MCESDQDVRDEHELDEYTDDENNYADPSFILFSNCEWEGEGDDTESKDCDALGKEDVENTLFRWDQLLGRNELSLKVVGVVDAGGAFGTHIAHVVAFLNYIWLCFFDVVDKTQLTDWLTFTGPD